MADAFGTGKMADFAGFVDCLWPTAEELALPPSFTVHDDPTCAGATFLLEDFDFFGASTAPTDEDFARLLLLGGGEAASDARAKPAGHSSATRSDSGAKAATPPRRRTASPPSTPEKLSEAKAAQKSERRYWTEDERAKFHAAMRQHGTDFAEISKFVGTRTSTQVRTHVQKYHLKLVREYQASKRKASEAAAVAAEQDKFARF